MPFQALVKMFLKNVPTALKTDLTPSQALFAPFLNPSQSPEKNLATGRIIQVFIHSPIVVKTDLIPFQAATAAFFMPSQRFTKKLATG